MDGTPEETSRQVSSSDHGYISEYLVHWTGKKGGREGAENLGSIASSLMLLLSQNPLHRYDWSNRIDVKMACFTDVPMQHSAKHCSTYGRFGIAFHKLKLMNKGAQPVFYATHAAKKDMHTIFKFLETELRQPSIDPEVFRALHRHFYFMKAFREPSQAADHANYYEREWRIGSLSLPGVAKWDRPNPYYHLTTEEGYPHYLGKSVESEGKEYFLFEKDDVAFLIAPRSDIASISNPHEFPIREFESLGANTNRKTENGKRE